MRSGSTFIQRFYLNACKLQKTPFYTVKTSKSFNGNGCLCPVRLLPLGGTDINFNETKINKDTDYIVQLRDPRDVLSSQYFYFYNCVDAGSDYKKEAKQYVRNHSIDDYVKSDIGGEFLFNRYSIISKIKDYQNINFITYEDMVLNFAQWIPIATKPLGLNKESNKTLFDLFSKEFKNVKETPAQVIKNGLRKSHMRKVYPGDHREKLTKKSINYLNDKLNDSLSFMQSISINYKYL